MSPKGSFLSIITLLSVISSAIAQPGSLDTLPRVFTVGEYSKQYEDLVTECELPLLQISAMSMDKASEHWLKVLRELELHAESMEFDIKGVRLWINIFWNADGSIRHMVYFPKRNSKNVDFKRLAVVLRSFCESSTTKLRAPACYSHSGSARFPTHAEFLMDKH